jgi:formylglycine-generating enzyme required for sulfatase activity
MSGNVWQWVQDKYHDSYEGAPVDGRAFERGGDSRVLRGGSFYYVTDDDYTRASYRNGSVPGRRHDDVGIRLARSR